MNRSKIAGKLCQYSPGVATLVAKFHSAMCFSCVTVQATSSSGISPIEWSMIEKADVGRLVTMWKFFSALNLVASMKRANVSSKITVVLARSR